MGYAEKLQQLCAMRGLDQSALAVKVGLSKSSMSRILSGVQEPKLRLAYDLAKALGVTLDYLVDDSPEFDPNAQLVVVSEDELTILKIVRRLSSSVSFDRLLAVPPPQEPHPMPTLPITAIFADLPDPRRETANKLHRLTDILTIATCAVIGGAESWEAIAEYGRTKEAFFRRYLRLDNGIPSPDTFERVFAKLAPGAFARAFGRWMASACEATGLVPIAVDGKSARAAKRDTATGCLHVVTAWAAESRLVLGTAAVPDGSNEIAAIPELLRVLDLAGAIVTIDAAGCQVENARIIREREGHYLLAVKDNQPTLRAAVEANLHRACEADFIGVRSDGHEAIEGGHGRHEQRYVTVIYDPAGLPAEWPDVAAVVQVNREREVRGERAVTSYYYIASHDGTAADLGRWVRGHWGIEDGLHWVLDVVFREDRSRIRAEDAGANLAMIRRVAVSLLGRAPGKGSGVTKRLKAGWDENYLLQVLQGIDACRVR